MNKSNNIDINPVGGTRDFPPDKMDNLNWLFDIWKNSAKKYCCKQFDSSILQNVELYTRKVAMI